MRRLLHGLRRMADDRRGGVAIISAVAMAGSLAAAGLVTDSAIVYLHKRSLQGATDLAALVAARNLAEADRIVERTLADNGFAVPEDLEVAHGRYEAAGEVAPPERFRAGAGPANAVRVRVASRPPVVLWPVVSPTPTPLVSAEAVAVSTGVASFSIGSRLASLDDGVFNALLGALVGGEVRLAVMDYRALADARVDLFALMERLAVDLDVAGDGFATLLDLSVGVADLANAAAELLDGATGHGKAARALGEVARVADSNVRLGDIFDAGPMGEAGLGGRAGLAAEVGALDLLLAAARLADGRRAIDLDLGVDVPGLLGLDLRVVVGEPAQASSWVTVGASGARVATAQTRIMLRARIGGRGLLSGVSLSVPIYVEVAAGTAELADVTCPMWSPDRASASVVARPGLASAWLGEADEAALPSFGSEVRPAAAELFRVPLARVTARARVEAANPAAETLAFTLREAEIGTVKSVRTHAFAGSVVASLARDADIRVEALGGGLGAGGLASLVAGLLEEAADPLDQVLYNALRAAGVGLGEIDVAVGGIRCDGSALVY